MNKFLAVFGLVLVSSGCTVTYVGPYHEVARIHQPGVLMTIANRTPHRLAIKSDGVPALMLGFEDGKKCWCPAVVEPFESKRVSISPRAYDVPITIEAFAVIDRTKPPLGYARTSVRIYREYGYVDSWSAYNSGYRTTTRMPFWEVTSLQRFKDPLEIKK